MKLLLNVNLYLKVFPFHMLPARVKHQIVDIIRIKYSGLFPRPKILLYAQIPNGFKILFFPMENMSFLIHC